MTTILSSGAASHGRVGFFISLSALLLLQSCTDPEAVATFAGNAQQALDQGVVLFADIHGSCVRRHADAASVAPIFVPAAIEQASSKAANDFPQCAVFAPQGDALAKASNLLSAYFRTLQQLAAFNTTAVSGPGQQAAANAATAAQLNTVQVDSATKLADLIMQVFTERYQQGHLVHIVLEADPSIASITQGFADIVSRDYEGLLREEQQTLAAQYQGVFENQAPAAILLLNRAYSEDLNTLKRRQAAAKAYIEALRQIREGHHQLAQSANRLNAKELTAALQPFSEKLQGLLPTLQKGF